MKHLSISLFLLCFLSLNSCKENKDNADPIPSMNNLVVGKFKTWFITDPGNNAGLYAEDDLAKEFAIAYGDKDSDGNLLNIRQILVRNKDAAAAVRVSFDKQDYITTIEVLSQNGKRALNFTEYDIVNKRVNVEMIDLSSKSVVVPKFSMALSTEILSKMNGYKSTKGGRISSSRCNWYRKLKIGFGLTDCHMQYYDSGKTPCKLVGLLTGPTGRVVCEDLTRVGTGLYAIWVCPSKEEALQAYIDECENLDEKEQERKYHECARNASKKFDSSGNFNDFKNDMDKCWPNPEDSENTNSSTGSSTGDPHLITSDNFVYDFHGHGEFIAAKSTTDNFEVQVRQEDVSNTQTATMNTAVAIQTGGDVICITAKPDQIYINNKLQDLNFDRLPLKENALIKKVNSAGLVAYDVITKFGDVVRVRFHGNYLLDYIFYLKESRKGKIIGLMGNYDGNSTNDLRLRNGNQIQYDFKQLYPGFTNSWRIQQIESLFYYDTGKTTETYTKLDFPKSKPIPTIEAMQQAEAICRKAGITTEPHLNNCILDVALTNNPSLATSAALAQAVDTRTPIPSVTKFIEDASYTATYIVQNNSLIVTFTGSQQFYPSFNVDVNQNGKIDANVDRAYGTTTATASNGATSTVVCSQYLLSVNSSTYCGIATSAGTVTTNGSTNYRFTIPLSEIDPTNNKTQIPLFVRFYNADTGWKYFPSYNNGEIFVKPFMLTIR